MRKFWSVALLMLWAAPAVAQTAVAPTVEMDVTQCRVTLSAPPPDTSSGWRAQFLRDGTTSVGKQVNTAPYQRVSTVGAGPHTFTVRWTKSGVAAQTSPAAAVACPVAPPPPPPPPPIVDCVPSPWAVSGETVWGACTNGVQTGTVTLTRTAVTSAQNGGKSCEPLTMTTTETRACVVPPPDPPASLLFELFSTVASTEVGQVYTLTYAWDAQALKSVSLDGAVPENTCTAGFTRCDGFVRKTATAPGSFTHTLTATRADGTPIPPKSVVVNVTGGPPPPPPTDPIGTWLAEQTMSTGSPVYSAIAARGRQVAYVHSAGTVFERHSTDEGATFATARDIGQGMAALERPVAVGDNGLMVVIGDTRSQSFQDVCCPRTGGDMVVFLSLDSGATWRRVVITTGKRAIRYSVATAGDVISIAYMTFNASNRWDTEEIHSKDRGATWSQPRVIAAGANVFGEQRPTIALDGLDEWVFWMGAQHATAGSCVLEGGVALPFGCWEIYGRHSPDGGETWDSIVRLTTTAPAVYSGRPSAARCGNRIGVAFDVRQQPGGSEGNEIGWLWSEDGGKTWDRSLIVRAPNEQTHATPACHPTRGWMLAWMDARSGVYATKAMFSADGRTWGAVEDVSAPGFATHAPSVDWSDNAALVLWQQATASQSGTVRLRRKVWGSTTTDPPPPPPPLPLPTDPPPPPPTNPANCGQPEASPSAGNAYFNSLLARSDCQRSYSLRDDRTYKRPRDGGLLYSNSLASFWTYDGTMGAAKLTIPEFAGTPSNTVAAAVAPGDTTIAFLGAPGDYAPDVSLRIGNEAVQLTTYVDPTTKRATVLRGTRGTSVGSHAAGTPSYLSNSSAKNMLVMPLGTQDGNTYFFTWDSYWTDSYRFALSGNSYYKAWQFLTCGERTWVEPRMRFDGGERSGPQRPGFDISTHVAALDFRLYRPGPNVSAPAPAAPMTGQFHAMPAAWLRHFVLLEQQANDYALLTAWAADETRAPVKLLDRLQVQLPADCARSVNGFWVELDTSQDTILGRQVGLNLVSYHRNFVALVNPGDVTPLLQRPVR